jgi:hypothetical protein
MSLLFFKCQSKCEGHLKEKFYVNQDRRMFNLYSHSSFFVKIYDQVIYQQSQKGNEVYCDRRYSMQF